MWYKSVLGLSGIRNFANIKHLYVNKMYARDLGVQQKIYCFTLAKYVQQNTYYDRICTNTGAIR